MQHPIIQVQSLQRSYPGSSSPIFNHFDFSLQKGDFCFIVGKSGSGKTTLVKFLLRQLSPPYNTILYHNEDIARFTNHEVQAYRRKLGVIFQDYKLIESMTVWENILYPLVINDCDPVGVIDYLEQIVRLLGLEDKKNSPCALLSGGEKQRVCIARALAMHPECIIADEPTGNLDRDNSRAIADSLMALHGEGHTILLITHDKRLTDYISASGLKVKSVVLGT